MGHSRLADGCEPVARLSAAQAGRTYFPEAMLRICPGYRAMQSGSPDRRNAPPPGKEQIYIASTYLSITPAAIAEP
ncbi:hypothetical protein ACI25L_004401, partial [Salmonella enterica subsp. enterica serovar Kentucky]|nr:hypothetical protein [Salmonella enterica]